jgi:hypothetical protein
MTHCNIRQDLYKDAQQILKEIQSLTEVQIQATQEQNHHKLMAADKELELLIGKKERAFGALRQHTTEHGC